MDILQLMKQNVDILPTITSLHSNLCGILCYICLYLIPQHPETESGEERAIGRATNMKEDYGGGEWSILTQEPDSIPSSMPCVRHHQENSAH